MVITDSRDPRFESSNQQILFATNCIEKTKMRGKEAGNGPIKKSEQMIKVQIGCETKNSFGGYVNIYKCSNDGYF